MNEGNAGIMKPENSIFSIELLVNIFSSMIVDVAG